MMKTPEKNNDIPKTLPKGVPAVRKFNLSAFKRVIKILFKDMFNAKV